MLYGDEDCSKALMINSNIYLNEQLWEKFSTEILLDHLDY